MGSFFFQNCDIAQTLTVRVNVEKSGSACFFLREQEISLKDFWQCATLYSQFQFPRCWSLINVLSNNRHFLVN